MARKSKVTARTGLRFRRDSSLFTSIKMTMLEEKVQADALSRLWRSRKYKKLEVKLKRLRALEDKREAKARAKNPALYDLIDRFE